MYRDIHVDIILSVAREPASPNARVAILTHEIRQMERCLREAAALWRVRGVTRVFQKGHHPPDLPVTSGLTDSEILA